MSGDRRVERQIAGVIGDSGGAAEIGDAGRLQPHRPAWRQRVAVDRLIVYQRMPAQIVRRPQWRSGFQQPRAAGRKHLVLHQRFDVQPGIAPAAVADRDVEIAGRQVDHIVGRGNPHIDLRPALLETMQPHDEPFSGEGR